MQKLEIQYSIYINLLSILIMNNAYVLFHAIRGFKRPNANAFIKSLDRIRNPDPIKNKTNQQPREFYTKVQKR